ncbi:hypothetical protein [Clostridium estertheticum]|uniref:hypothetical protein n=1 Tax=Clostridium estertheticum TaxID=238834 RepID=UPI001C0B41B4|nr:hypothetical protein [Clostridium estertheticum]MBU3173405.1 hypothetical protein [Clostridium estertheticum]
MLNETIKKIMKEHFISNNNEAQEALDFIRDLVDAEIEHIEKTEPQAINSIAAMKETNSHIGNLLDELN